MTAKYGALLAGIPSMTAVDKPRRPIRWTPRMREFGLRETADLVSDTVGGIVIDVDYFPLDPA